MTPEKCRSHARFLRQTAEEKRVLADDPDAMAHWRKHWLADARRLEEHADWFEERAGRGEITVEYEEIAQ